MFPILFSIGPVTVYSYGFMIALGVLVSFFLIKKDILKSGYDAESLSDLILTLLLSGVLGARLFYILNDLPFFIQNPLEIFKVWHGGLIVYGGVITALAVLLVYARKKKASFWNLGDMIAPFLALSQAFGRIGCFLNGCCWGIASESCIAVQFPGHDHSVLPVQLFFSAFHIFLFLVLVNMFKRRRFQGQVFFAYFIFYSIGRFLLQFFRGDLSDVWFVFDRPQVISLIVFLISLVACFIRVKSARVK